MATTYSWRRRAVSAASITATLSAGGYGEALTVIAFKGGTGTGSVVKAGAASAAPSATLTTTTPGRWVFAVGDDWDNAILRTLGANQTPVSQATDTAGDTYWVQSETSPTPAAATAVTTNDTAPTTDRWNLTLVEIE
jgi:hypothetical protein